MSSAHVSVGQELVDPRNGVNETLFTSLRHARQVLTDWRHDYNHFRPCSAT